VNIDWLTVKKGLTFIEGIDTSDAFNKRGFTRPVITNQGHHLAITARKIDFGEGLHGSKSFGYTFQF
jgi:hypothetical protein